MMGAYGPLAIVDVSPDNARSFSQNVARYLGITPHPTRVSKFKDGETNVVIDQTMRDHDVYLFQSYIEPLGERKTELKYGASAVRSGGDVKRTNAVLPYCFGMRGDRQTEARQSVPIEVFIRDLYGMGIQNVVTVTLHNDTLETAFRTTGDQKGIKVEQLHFEPLAARYIINDATNNGYKRIGIVSPDTGGAKRCEKVADLVTHYSSIEVVLAAGLKTRTEHDKAKITGLMGRVGRLPAYLYDDIGDTFGTIADAKRVVKRASAAELSVIAVHPVMGNGYEKPFDSLCDDPFVRQIVFGNTLPLKGRATNDPKVHTIPLEPLVADALRAMNQSLSMSKLHEYTYIAKLYDSLEQKNLVQNPA